MKLVVAISTVVLMATGLGVFAIAQLSRVNDASIKADGTTLALANDKLDESFTPYIEKGPQP